MIALPPIAGIPLRQRLFDKMDIRRLGPKTQRNKVADIFHAADPACGARQAGI